MRQSDETDPFREKTVQLLDDFKISGVNGTRILSLCESVISRPIRQVSQKFPRESTDAETYYY